MEGDLILCDAASLFDSENHCDFVRSYCENPESSSRYYYELYFCGIEENIPFFVVFCAVFLFTAFYLLASTAETHLSPALSKISNKLKISETLAGVTLVAFANGAPDIISSFSAGESREGISLVIGSIFGGGLFVTTFVLATVILAAKKIEVKNFSKMYSNAIGFYLFSTLYIIILGCIGYVNLISAIGFLAIFPCYVAVVYFIERYQKQVLKPLSTPFLDNMDTATTYASMVDNGPRENQVPQKNKPAIEMGSHFLYEHKPQEVEGYSPRIDPPEAKESQEKELPLSGGTAKPPLPKIEEDSLEARQRLYNIAHIIRFN